jgi:hypothetical protein
MPGILKILPSKYWNGDVIIIGNREGLESLQTLVNKAVEKKTGSELFTETDGNQYFVYLKELNVDMQEEEWQKLPMQYDDDDVKLTNEEEMQLHKFLND